MTPNIFFKKKENAIKTSKNIAFAQNKGQNRIPRTISVRVGTFRCVKYHGITQFSNFRILFLQKKVYLGLLPKEDYVTSPRTGGTEFPRSPSKSPYITNVMRT